MRRDQLPAEAKRSYVLDRYKVVYVSTPKAACTSLKWVMAELAGEDLEQFERVLRPGTTPAGTIHPRRFWHCTPSLQDLDAEQLASVDAAHGWHIFAVVRHPTSRVWSAWQEKLLLREPFMVGKVPERLLPPVPRSTADVVQAFQRFVLSMADEDCRDLMSDPHFRPQHEVLAAERVPYTRVYTTSEMPQAMADLEQQVRAHGGGGLPSLPSDNETPLRPLRSMFTEDVLARIGEVYAEDLQRWFPDADLVPSGTDSASEYPPTQLLEVGRLVDRHARIGQLTASATRLERENARLRAELAARQTR